MQFLNLNQLSEKLGGRSRSSILRDKDEGRLPKPTKIGARLYWVEAEVEAWIATRSTEEG